MKVAVVYSGLPRTTTGRPLRKFYEHSKKVFDGADFYLGTWRGQEHVMQRIFPDVPDVYYIDEPKVDYHPFIDIDPLLVPTTRVMKAKRNATNNHVFRETSSHQTKQIIGHCGMLDVIPKEYDVYVRLRYDTVVYDGDYEPFLRAAADGTTIGWGTQYIGNFENLSEFETGGKNHKGFLLDQMIMHSPDIDTNRCYKLHQEKKLISAEYGWWQVFGQGRKHRCMNGWANPDRSVPHNYLDKI